MPFYKPVYILITAFIFVSCNQHPTKTSVAQAGVDSLEKNQYVNTDISPMDMSWCPANYPVEKMKGNDSLKLIARITYSRPHKKDRMIFGNTAESLCAYEKPWRLGANEATEINLFENVSIAGKNLNKGTYVMYCIPHADRWTIIFNTNLYTWGLHIDESKDIFKTEVPVMEQSPALEDFTIAFQNTETGADLLIAWDNVKTVLPFTFAK